jgi:hypothetical protein
MERNRSRSLGNYRRLGRLDTERYLSFLPLNFPRIKFSIHRLLVNQKLHKGLPLSMRTFHTTGTFSRVIRLNLAEGCVSKPQRPGSPSNRFILSQLFTSTDSHISSSLGLVSYNCNTSSLTEPRLHDHLQYYCFGTLNQRLKAVRQ